ncbi:hypothetical protein ACFE04_001060 [Oxalis oulophora]
MKPSDRPSMNKVVEMLQADFQTIPIPPKPFLTPREIVNEWESKKHWILKKKIDEVISNVVEPALQSCAIIHEDRSGKISKQYLQVALDFVGPSAGLPPIGAVEQVDNVMQVDNVTQQFRGFQQLIALSPI